MKRILFALSAAVLPLLVFCFSQNGDAQSSRTARPATPAAVQPVRNSTAGAQPSNGLLLFNRTKEFLKQKLQASDDAALNRKAYDCWRSSNIILRELERLDSGGSKDLCLAALQSDRNDDRPLSADTPIAKCADAVTDGLSARNVDMMAFAVSTEPELKSKVLGMDLEEVKKIRRPMNPWLLKHFGDQFGRAILNDIQNPGAAGGIGTSGGSILPPGTAKPAMSSTASFIDCLRNVMHAGDHASGGVSGGGGGVIDPAGKQDSVEKEGSSKKINPVKDFTQEEILQLYGANTGAGGNDCRSAFLGPIDPSKVKEGWEGKPKSGEWNPGGYSGHKADGSTVWERVNVRKEVGDDGWRVEFIRKENGVTTWISNINVVYAPHAVADLLDEQIWKDQKDGVQIDQDVYPTPPGTPNPQKPPKPPAPPATPPGTPASTPPAPGATPAAPGTPPSPGETPPVPETPPTSPATPQGAQTIDSGTTCLEASFASCGFGSLGGGPLADCVGLPGNKDFVANPDPNAPLKCGPKGAPAMQPKLGDQIFDPPRTMLGIVQRMQEIMKAK